MVEFLFFFLVIPLPGNHRRVMIKQGTSNSVLKLSGIQDYQALRIRDKRGTAVLPMRCIFFAFGG